jgi:hypothetical protein
MNEWLHLVPNGDTFRLRYKIVRTLVPTRAMLGPKHLVVCARRMPDAQCWEVRYASKRFWRRWPEFPLIEKGMAEIENINPYWFVRQAFVLADSPQMSADSLGSDCRILAYGQLDHRPWVRTEEIGKFVRRVWFLRTDDWRDGVDLQPDSSCVSPRGRLLTYRQVPSPQAIAHAKRRHADYAIDCEAKAQGKVRYLGSWFTQADYQAARKYEKQIGKHP